MRVLALFLLAPLLAAADPSEKTVSKGVHHWMKSLSLREKVAQLFMIPFSGHAPNPSSKEYRKFVHLVRDVRVGARTPLLVAQGLLVQPATPHEPGAFPTGTHRMTRIPLIV